MGSRLRSLWREVRFRLRLHPSYEELLAFRDAEHDKFKSRRIAAHLDRCARCQVERDQIEEDIRTFHTADPWLNALAPPPLDEGLAHLQRAVQAWEVLQFPASAYARAESRGDEYLGRRLSAELDIYLGPRAAATLLQRSGGGCRDLQELVGAVEPILKDFCGQAASSAVTTRISRIWNRYHTSRGDSTGPATLRL